MNFLERLVAEWLAHQGYFVKTNFRFDPRVNGGYDGEMDVIALRLPDRELLHVELSSDGESWAQRVARFNRKFERAERSYANAFGPGFTSIRRIAVVGARGRKGSPEFALEVDLISIDELMRRIKIYVGDLDPAKRAIPETFPLLRAVQFAVWFGDSVVTERS